MTALNRLAPRDSARVRLDLDGSRVDYDGERRGVGFSPSGIELYGH